MAVLVDSSVWVSASDSRNPECLKLKRLIAANERVCIVKAIQVEVCQGARSDGEFRQLWENLLGFEILEATDLLWGKSAWNYFKCRRKGLTVGTLDCLIATVARENEISLWTLDKQLRKTRSVIGFDEYAG